MKKIIITFNSKKYEFTNGIINLPVELENDEYDVVHMNLSVERYEHKNADIIVCPPTSYNIYNTEYSIFNPEILNKSIIDIVARKNDSVIKYIENGITKISVYDGIMVNQYPQIDYIKGQSVIKNNYENNRVLTKNLKCYTNSYGSYNNNIGYDKAINYKVLIENNFKFLYEELDYVYYDIETYDTESYSIVPQYNRTTSHISIVCFIHISKNSSKCYILCHKNAKLYSNGVAKFIKERNINLPYEIITCNNEYAMSNYFFIYLSNIKNLNIVMGFNSNVEFTSEYNKLTGYDLPFLIQRSDIRLNSNTAFCKINGQSCRQINTINELPFSYFYDMRVLLENSVLPSIKNEMERHTLNDFLSAFKIDLKANTCDYYTLQKRLHLLEDDITDLLNYCLYDVYALHLLLEKSGALNQLLYLGELLGLPLNSILYRTMPRNLEIYCGRKITESGYLLCYDNMEDTTTYQGAYTEINDILVVHKNVLPMDYESLYPHCFIDGNLSPETNITNIYNPEIHKNVNIFTFTDNKQDSIQKFIFDKTNIGVIPQILLVLKKQRYDAKAKLKKYKSKNIKTQKDNIKIKKYDCIQNSVKLCMNTIYGLNGSACIFYNAGCALTCTYLGRNAILTAKDEYMKITNYIPIVIDTDSIIGKFDQEYQPEKLTNNIKNIIGANYNLQKEDKYDYYMASKSKKSYLGLSENCTKLTVKGISWSKYTNKGKEYIRNLFREVLTTGNCEDVLTKFYQTHIKILQEGIKQPNWKDIIEPYTALTKTNGKSSTIKSIRSRYELHCDYINLIEVINTGKFKISEISHPLNLYNGPAENINIRKLLKSFMSSVFKLLDGKDIINEYEEYDIVHYRIEYYLGNSKVRNQINLNCSIGEFVELIALDNTLTNKMCNKSIHEVMISGRKYRLFIDLDKSNYGELCIVQQEINKLLGKNNISWVHTTNGEKSFHAYSNIAMTMDEMKSLMNIVKNKTKISAIDTSVYNNGRSLRTIYCPKIDLKNNTINRNSVHIPINKEYEKYVISNIQDCEYNNDLCFKKEYLYSFSKNKDYTTKHITEDYISQVNEWIKNTLGITKYKYEINKIYFTLILDSWDCKICNEKHNKSRPTIVLLPNKAYLKCWQNSDNKDFYLDIKEYTKPEYNNKFIEYQNEKEKFDITADNSMGDIGDIIKSNETLIMIQSSVGTGKTKALQRYIDSLPIESSIVVISFRRSFTRSLAKKINFEQYLTIKEPIIKLSKHPRLIIQTDSLPRLHYDKFPDVLILDEVVSIFETLTPRFGNAYTDSIQIINNLLCNSKQVICMDAFLSKNIVKIIESITNRSADYYINKYIPYKQNMKTYIDNPTQLFYNLYSDLKLQKNKKIGVFITSIKKAEILYGSLINNGIKVLLITGEDAMPVRDKNGKETIMVKLKNNYCTNPEQIYIDYDIFIYTSTLTAGISIENTSVDKFYAYYNKKTISPLSFVQGMYRIRDRKETVLYVERGNTSYDYTLKEPCNNYNADDGLIAPLKCLINTLDNQMKIDREYLLVKFLNRLGVTLDIININDSDAIKLKNTDHNMVEEYINAKFIPQEIDYKIVDLLNSMKKSDNYKLDKEINLDEIKLGKVKITELIIDLKLKDNPLKLYEYVQNVETFNNYYTNRHGFIKLYNILVKNNAKTIFDLDSNIIQEKINNQSAEYKILMETNMLVKESINLEKAKKDKNTIELIKKLGNEYHTTEELCEIIKDNEYIKQKKRPVADIDNLLKHFNYKLHCKVIKTNGKAIRNFILCKINEIEITDNSNEVTEAPN